MSVTRRVMYASDLSPASLAAFPHAIKMAKATGAELIVIHVLPSPLPLVGELTYIDPETWDRVFAGAQAEAHKQLEPFLAQARDAGLQVSGCSVLIGMLLLGLPAAGVASVVRLPGLYAFVFGALILVAAFRLRGGGGATPLLAVR